jgi:hypothetical protein
VKRVESEEWRMKSEKNGEWRVKSGEWRMKNGEWRMERVKSENSKLQAPKVQAPYRN